MTRLRGGIPALAAVAALAAALLAPPVTLRAAHSVCATKHHGCGKPAVSARCCCVSDAQSGPAPVPAIQRADRPATAPMPPAIVAAAQTAAAITRGADAGRLRRPPDLHIRFENLRI